MLTRQMCTSPCWGLLLNFLVGMRQVYISFVQFLVLKRTLGFSFFFFPFPFFWMELPRARLWDGVFKNCKIWYFPKKIKAGWTPYLPGWYWYEVGVTSLGPCYQCWQLVPNTGPQGMHILVLCEFFNNFRFLVFLKLWRSKNLSNNIIGFFKFQTWRFLTELVIF